MRCTFIHFILIHLKVDVSVLSDQEPRCGHLVLRALVSDSAYVMEDGLALLITLLHDAPALIKQPLLQILNNILLIWAKLVSKHVFYKNMYNTFKTYSISILIWLKNMYYHFIFLLSFFFRVQ